MRFSVLSNPPGSTASETSEAGVGLWLRPMNTTPPRLRRAYFECRHGQLHVHNAIPVGGGFDELTTLICLHGAAGTGRHVPGSVETTRHSRSIYSPDLPGCGESDASTAPLSVAAYAEAIADFLDSMRFRQVDLLGVGAGAAVAVELAHRRPKVVRKLCLLGSPGKEAAAAAPGAQRLAGCGCRMAGRPPATRQTTRAGARERDPRQPLGAGARRQARGVFRRSADPVVHERRRERGQLALLRAGRVEIGRIEPA